MENANPVLLTGVVGQGLVVLVVIILFLLFSMIKIIKEYERAVVFRLGKYSGVRGPGIIFIIPVIERIEQRGTAGGNYQRLAAFALAFENTDPAGEIGPDMAKQNLFGHARPVTDGDGMKNRPGLLHWGGRSRDGMASDANQANILSDMAATRREGARTQRAVAGDRR